MARLPVLKKRRSRKQRALDLAKSTAKVWTVVKVSSTGTRAAKKGAKAYGAAKAAKVAGRPLLKVAAVPVAVAGGVVVWRKVQNGSASNGASAERPLGPVATAETVSPPADAAAEAASSEAHAS
jgi:1-acyl-sn-glycerol-3-phosphate acyltransferase